MSGNDGTGERTFVNRRDVLRAAGALSVVGGVPISSVARAQSDEVPYTLVSEDFENISTGGYPSGWSKEGNTNQSVTNNIADTDTKSLRMSGSFGGCWEAISDIPANIPAEGEVTISLSIRPTSDGSEGCHSHRGKANLQTATGSWAAGNGTQLFRFKTDGNIYVSGNLIRDYQLDQWYDVHITYRRSKPDDGNGNGTVTKIVTIGDSTQRVEHDAPDFADNFSYLRISSGDFVCYLDDIEVTVESLDVGRASADVTIDDEDADVIQTVTNTRLTDGDIDPVDPPLISGDHASVSFGLTVDGLDDLPDDAGVRANISTSEGDDFNTELSASALSEIADAEYPVTQLADALDGDDAPVFVPTTELDSVTITIEDTSTDEYEIAGDSVRLQSGEDFDVVDRDELKIGVVLIEAPQTGWDNNGNPEYAYGTSKGTIKYGNNYNSPIKAIEGEYVPDLEAYIENEFPVENASVEVVSDSITGNEKGMLFGDGHAEDHYDAYDAVIDEIPDADVEIAIVPHKSQKAYYDYHGLKFRGLHLQGDLGLSQPRAAATVGWRSIDDTVVTTAHEMCHHFLGGYEGSVTFDGKHLRPNYNNGEYDGVVSTALDIGAGGIEASDGRYSFMSYMRSQVPTDPGGNYDQSEDFRGKYSHFTDEITHQKLIDSEFLPHPPTPSRGSMATGVTGFVNTSDAEVTALDIEPDDRPWLSIEGGDVTVTVVDPDGNALHETTTTNIQATGQAGGSRTIELAPFSVPFEGDAAAIAVESGGRTTTVEPVSGTLSETIAALPSEAFARNPDERRAALQSKVDAVGEQMDAGAYRGAANKLSQDIRDKVEKWLVKYDPEAANVPDKQGVLDKVELLADHVSSLAGGHGGGNGRGRN